MNSEPKIFVCIHCDKEFTPTATNGHQKLCSEECKAARKLALMRTDESRARRREYMETYKRVRKDHGLPPPGSKPKPSEVGRLRHTCPCGAEFRTNNIYDRWCKIDCPEFVKFRMEVCSAITGALALARNKSKSCTLAGRG